MQTIGGKTFLGNRDRLSRLVAVLWLAWISAGGCKFYCVLTWSDRGDQKAHVWELLSWQEKGLHKPQWRMEISQKALKTTYMNEKGVEELDWPSWSLRDHFWLTSTLTVGGRRLKQSGNDSNRSRQGSWNICNQRNLLFWNLYLQFIAHIKILQVPFQVLLGYTDSNTRWNYPSFPSQAINKKATKENKFPMLLTPSLSHSLSNIAVYAFNFPFSN